MHLVIEPIPHARLFEFDRIWHAVFLFNQIGVSRNAEGIRSEVLPVRDSFVAFAPIFHLGVDMLVLNFPFLNVRVDNLMSLYRFVVEPPGTENVGVDLRERHVSLGHFHLLFFYYLFPW